MAALIGVGPVLSLLCQRLNSCLACSFHFLHSHVIEQLQIWSSSLP